VSDAAAKQLVDRHAVGQTTTERIAAFHAARRRLPAPASGGTRGSGEWLHQREARQRTLTRFGQSSASNTTSQSSHATSPQSAAAPQRHVQQALLLPQPILAGELDELVGIVRQLSVARSRPSSTVTSGTAADGETRDSWRAGARSRRG
jgi:hypothetical protein